MIKSACKICEYNPSSSLKKQGEQKNSAQFTIALIGNPNTGKSTIFNALTGLRQHTGNWPGKTVTHAEGYFSYQNNNFKIIDLPGTYSLLSHSDDEEVARDFILFQKPNVTLIVIDAGRMQRHFSLLLQVLDITDNVILCVNLMDEAHRHGIDVDIRTLSRDLGIPVVATSARSQEGISELLSTINQVATKKILPNKKITANVPDNIKVIVEKISTELSILDQNLPNKNWIALRLLENDQSIIRNLENGNLSSHINAEKLQNIYKIIEQNPLPKNYQDELAEIIYTKSAKIIHAAVSFNGNYQAFRI